MTKATPGKSNARPSRSRWKRVLYWGVVLGVWGIILGGAGVAYLAWDLPNVDQAIGATRKPDIRIVTQSGREIARRGDRYGETVYLKDLPPALPQAIIATEDRRFYEHFGIDPIGIVRAVVANIRAGSIVQGGSTITQQVAKNLFLTPRRTFKRKAQEVLLALWLEHKFTKTQILTIYVNRTYFGRGIYGVDGAARYYFSVPAKRLNVYQSAMLAGMLKGPNRYNPISAPKRAARRAKLVLENMKTAGYLDQAGVKAALRTATKITSMARPKVQSTGPMANYFIDWVLSQIGDYVSLDRDITVTVTLDPAKQLAAQRAVALMMKKNGPAARRKVGEVALVALAPDGAVLAMIGGKNWRTSPFNRAVQAKRQPGSAFKPFVYLAGFEAGLRPDTIMKDEPITIDGWSPGNFKKRDYLGPVSLSDALMRSINTVAVKVSEKAGRKNVQAMARRLGITDPLTDGPSLALGVSDVSVLELTAAYATFATGGIGVWPYGISEIRDSQGRPLYIRQGGGPGRVIPAGYAGAMNRILSQVISNDRGTGKAARLGRPAAGKTGTSQGYRDAWFVGYTPNLITGVWMGNDNATPMKGVTGGSFPARLWKAFMLRALKDTPARALPAENLPLDQVAPTTRSASPSIGGALKGFFKSLFGQ